MTEPIFEVVTTTLGAVSIRDNRVMETMHNPLGPWKEIQELYIQPSQLSKRIKGSSTPLVLYDVGLGAGSNAMGALLSAFDAVTQSMGKGEGQGLHILSFEKDLTLAHFALKERAQFPDFSWAWDSFQTLLEQKHWKHPKLSLSWTLYPGDFLETLNQSLPLADIIFYDPYSPKMNSEMWTYSGFAKLREKCRSDRETLLLTYSRATSVRAALLLAGFSVGFGRSIGLKEETTMASTLLDALEHPLDQRWLDRWRRSHTAFPSDVSPQEIEALKVKIESHPQFTNLG